jgi:alpha-N-arabinofuranosidase
VGESISGWDNAFVNFDQSTWFPAPNYVVMKLWHDHYAPLRVAIEGETAPLNAVATKSADGRTLCFKAINPLREKVAVDLALKTGLTASEAKIKLVAPGSLQARNTLEEPHAVRPIPGRISIDEGRVRFKLPGLSAGVVTIKLR